MNGETIKRVFGWVFITAALALALDTSFGKGTAGNDALNALGLLKMSPESTFSPTTTNAPLTFFLAVFGGRMTAR